MFNMLVLFPLLTYILVANAKFYQGSRNGKNHNTDSWKTWFKSNHSSHKFNYQASAQYNYSTGFETEEYCIYDLRMQYIEGCPDGVKKRIIGFNGQFPGPTLHCTEGKTMVVRVTNDIKDNNEPTSIHWHGIQQTLSPFYDGPQSITQCPIIRDTSMIYKFQVFQSGTYWYHSHHSYQYVDGAWGFLIVRNSPAECWQSSYDEEQLISINDWTHRPAEDLTQIYLKQGIFPDTNSSLINGYGTFNCSQVEKGQKCSSNQGPSVIDVTRGKRYRFRILNSSGARTYNFSIDNHKMVVIETDGVDTFKSTEVDVIPIWPAQRYSILVTMNQPLNEYWIRISGEPVGSAGLLGRAILRYSSGTATNQPSTGTQQSGGNQRPGSNQQPGGNQRPGSNKQPGGNEYPSGNQRPGGNQQPGGNQYPSGNQHHTHGRNPRAAGDDPDDGAFQGRPDFNDIPWDDIITAGGVIPDTVENLKSFFPAEPPTFDKKHQAREDSKHAQMVKKVKLPTTSPVNPARAVLLDDQQCPPLQFGVEGGAPAKYDRLITINSTDCPIKGSPVRMCMNGQPFVPLGTTQRPILYQLIQGLKIPTSTRPVYTPTHRQAIWVVINNYHPLPHPWHMHGHSFWVMGHGAAQAGPFVESRDLSKLTQEGVRRDTTFSLGNSWVVIAYTTDNPGAWFFHCHINWHLEAGLGMTFIEEANTAKQVYQFPPLESEEVCNKVGVSL